MNKEIQKALQEKGWSGNRLAQEAMVSQSTVSRAMNGGSIARYNQLLIAGALNPSFEMLFNGSKN